MKRFAAVPAHGSATRNKRHQPHAKQSEDHGDGEQKHEFAQTAIMTDYVTCQDYDRQARYLAGNVIDSIKLAPYRIGHRLLKPGIGPRLGNSPADAKGQDYSYHPSESRIRTVAG